MAGCLSFYAAMNSLGLRPILGCEFYFNAEAETKTPDNRKCQHIVLLAKNIDGWRALLKLQKWSYTDGYYFRPRIGIDQLRWRDTQNLVCLTACVGGILGKDIGDYIDRYIALKTLFGDDLYVEFQGHDFDLQRETNQKLYEIPKIKPIVTSDCHFILREHQKVQKVIKTNSFNNKEAAESYAAAETNYMASAAEIYTLFKRYHSLPMAFVAQGMSNTEEVFEKCDVKLESRRYLPRFSETVVSDDLFLKLTKLSLVDFLKDESVLRYATRKEYLERFAKEVKVITKYHLTDYFLIVWDVLRFARSRGIYTGLGRGSSAGSFICYLLKITQINPLQYDLIFERMLNEIRCESGELPDIDLDLESARRHEVKEYIINKYGSDKVCEIGTYGRLKLKSSIIDFGKQFGFTHSELLAITTKLELDKEDAQSLDAAMDESPQLTEFMHRHPEYAFAVETLNGQIKSQSIHPAGVLICSEEIANVTPVKTQKSTKTKQRVVVTQSEDVIVLKQGLIKLDLLGLKEYDIFKSVIDNAPTDLTMTNYVEVIHKRAVDHSDPEVWAMFQRGQTDAVFQFASEGMRNLLIEMKPDCMNDLIAAVALYRPGCLENGWHLQYCRRKNGAEKVEYVCPEVESVLGKTYGIPIYQEQVMAICNVVGGIPLAESDIIRSALGKKDLEKLAKFRPIFVKNAAEKLGGESAAIDYWKQIEKFAGYSFNLSHSAVYALVAYINQFFKCKYPSQYWAAVLDFDARKNETEKLSANRRAAAEMGVKVLSPSINKSRASFYVEIAKSSDALDDLLFAPPIRWSFNGIKGVGPKTADELERCQPYESLMDLYNRVNKSKVKLDAMLALAYAGTFDCWYDRSMIVRLTYEIHNRKKTTKEKKLIPSTTNNFLLYKFYETLGFFEQRLKRLYDRFPVDARGRPLWFVEADVRGLVEGSPAIVGGILVDVSTFRTRAGDAMGKARLLDLDEEIELTFFPRAWSAHRTKIRDGHIVLVNGEKSTYSNKKNLINVNDIEIISSFSS
jgi:DNA polymerase-3 subunit alpha